MPFKGLNCGQPKAGGQRHGTLARHRPVSPELMPPGCSFGSERWGVVLNVVWWNLEPSECYEREWLRWLLGNFELREMADVEDAPCGEPVILLVNFSRFVFGGLRAVVPHRTEQARLRGVIRALKAAKRRVGMFHLGDECYADSIACYGDVEFVFRQYYRAEAHARFAHCHHLPLGYTAGFTPAVDPRPMNMRSHVWCFAGQARRARRSMVRSALRIPEGSLHLTKRWADPAGLGVEAYSKLMGDSRFALCPVGNCSVDCLRVYEALEAGAIPIVESHGFGRCLASFVDPRRVIKHGLRDGRFWSRNLGYWDRVFPTGFPCLRIKRWADLPGVIKATDAEAKAKTVHRWWSDTKHDMKHRLRMTIEAGFS